MDSRLWCLTCGWCCLPVLENRLRLIVVCKILFSTSSAIAADVAKSTLVQRVLSLSWGFSIPFPLVLTLNAMFPRSLGSWYAVVGSIRCSYFNIRFVSRRYPCNRHVRRLIGDCEYFQVSCSQ
ncbi:hypothetical protein L249_8530 [Ophiocordyceps polyrhachis-furcata BCC 54312]|uniref:Uncharacterized protein n=1 Tax=Ophiocordyceps polyrhachis-furcata BCC 54312 TaxID=1330021 RepID=A0A367L753_9HYPO|nr:hypothetical protein L249_8530 [Ophiocordyceps polyrhachis-furcata BCC 54312]